MRSRSSDGRVGDQDAAFLLGQHGGNCIEIAAMARMVAVRDSKDPDGPVLAFGPNDWQRFADQVKADA
jgi:hypothetical protein